MTVSGMEEASDAPEKEINPGCSRQKEPKVGDYMPDITKKVSLTGNLSERSGFREVRRGTPLL